MNIMTSAYQRMPHRLRGGLLLAIGLTSAKFTIVDLVAAVQSHAPQVSYSFKGILGAMVCTILGALYVTLGPAFDSRAGRWNSRLMVVGGIVLGILVFAALRAYLKLNGYST